MRNFTLSFAAILLVFSTLFAQETKKDLTEKSALLYQQGDFEKAVEAAEKVVKLEKNEKSKETNSYTNALLNLARINQGYILALQNKADASDLSDSKKTDLSRKTSEIVADTETLLRQILKLNEDGGRDQTTQNADAKRELAALVQNYNPAKPTVMSARARIDEAENLLAESLTTYEQVKGKDDEKTLAVVLQNGDFYYRYANFEKALPFYERYIQTAENARGTSYPDLAETLRRYEAILFTTFQDSKADEALNKIEKITGKKEQANPVNLSLNLRSGDAVAFGARTMQASRGNVRPFSGATVISVKVVVEENGKIVEAIADSKDKDLRARAEKEISKWRVRPFTYQGNTYRMRGYLTYFEQK